MKMPIQYIKPHHQKSVAVIGAGWYGVHIALELKKQNYEVIIFESNSEIMQGVSGRFGIRVHAGPHYPRSDATRESCLNDFNEFCLTYPEIIKEQEHSIYALAIADQQGRASKTNKEDFRRVCGEFQYQGEVEPSSFGFNTDQVQAAFDLKEPTAVVGEPLREYFESKLFDSKVEVKCNTRVTQLYREQELGYTIVECGNAGYVFNHVVNTTGFQDLLPENKILPFDMEFVYQPCLGLVYRDKDLTVTKPPVIFMDGEYPCLMPYDCEQNEEDALDKYTVLTHGRWTILGSYKTADEAHKVLGAIDDDFILENVKENCESHILALWPDFGDQYEYVGWEGAVLAKYKTASEFRSSIVFQDKHSGIVYAFPGKINNIFSAAREVCKLLESKKLLECDGEYLYVENGRLSKATHELAKKPTDGTSTAELQPYSGFFGNPQQIRRTLNRSNSSETWRGKKSVESSRSKTPIKFFVYFVLIAVIRESATLFIQDDEKNADYLANTLATFIAASVLSLDFLDVKISTFEKNVHKLFQSCIRNNKSFEQIRSPSKTFE